MKTTETELKIINLYFIPKGFRLLNYRRFRAEVLKAALGSSSCGRPENLYWDFFKQCESRKVKMVSNGNLNVFQM